MSADIFRCTDRVSPAQHIRGYYRATANSEEDELQLAIKQYTPLDNLDPQPGDVTIIACHAAGLFKELYEPLFDELYYASKKSNGRFRIRSIWIADVASHGKSGVLNEGRLGLDTNYEDHSRDLLHMINIFRKELPKPLVGIGHSMGADNILHLSLLHPRLFDGVIFVESILNKEHKEMNMSLTAWLTARPDVWANLEDAMKDTRKGNSMRTWDKRVVDLWKQHAFRELPTMLYPEPPAAVARKAQESGTRPVTLSTTKHHDVRTYARGIFPKPEEPLDSFKRDRRTHPDITEEEMRLRKEPVYRPESVTMFRQLPHLRPSCLFVFGSKSPLTGSSARGRAEKLAATGTAIGGSGGVEARAVREAIVEGAAHFAPLEQPKAIAEVAAPWIEEQVEKWREAVEQENQTYGKLDVREKAMVDDDWRWWMKEWYVNKPKREKATREKASKL